MHCAVLRHLIVVLLLQMQCSMNIVMIINLSYIIGKEDNTYKPVICFCVKLFFNDLYFIIYLKVYLSPLGSVRCLSSFVIGINLPGCKEPCWENESLLLMLLCTAALTTQSTRPSLASLVNANFIMYDRAVIYKPCSKLNSINYSYLLCR